MEGLLPPPVGTSDWARFSRTSYCVDKTLILKDLIDSESTVVLFTRPRRRASRRDSGCFAKVSQTVGSWRRDGFRASDNKLRLAGHASAAITGCIRYVSYACEPRPLLL